MKNEPLECYLLKDSLYIESMFNVLPRDMKVSIDIYEYLYLITKASVNNVDEKSVDVIGNYSAFYKSKYTDYEYSDALIKMSFENNNIRKIMINHTIYLYNMYLYFKHDLNNIKNSYKEDKVFVDNFDKILGNVDLGVLEKEITKLKNTKLNYLKNNSDKIIRYKRVLFVYRNAYKLNSELLLKLNISNGEKLYILLKCKGANKLSDFDNEIVNKFTEFMPKTLIFRDNIDSAFEDVKYGDFYNQLVKQMSVKQIEVFDNIISNDYNKIFKRYVIC